MSTKLNPRRAYAEANFSALSKFQVNEVQWANDVPVLVIPLTPECVEALENKAWNASCASEFAIKKILAAIGIRAPKKSASRPKPSPLVKALIEMDLARTPKKGRK